MSGLIDRLEYHISKNRLETLVDGIFTIAMTILVLGITPPKPDISQAHAVLTGQIIDLLPEVFLFIVSFLILAGFWLSHHRQFHFVRVIDSRLLWINIFLLISLVFIPFSTDVAGVNIIIIGLIFSYHAHYIFRSKNLCDPNIDRKLLQTQLYHSVLITVVASIAVIVSMVNPEVSLLVYLVIPIAGYFLQQPAPE